MVMKTYFKTLKRMFKKRIARMFSILFIILISVGLVSGVSASPTKVNDSIYEYYKNQNVFDLIVKSTNITGFTSSEITILEEMYGVDNIMLGTSFDIETNDQINRYYYLDLDNININKLELLDGKMPTNDTEVLVERKIGKLKEYKIGDKITYNDITYTVSGIVKNPLYFQNLEEPSYIDDKDLDSIIYFNTNQYMPINDIYISFEDKTNLDNMSDSYEDIVLDEKEKIMKELDNITVLSLYENVSFYKIFTLTEKINIISVILLVGFICVSALVVLSTMTRLIEEERKKSGMLKNVRLF